MDDVGGRLTIVKSNKPYLAMIFIQLVQAGLSLLSKAAITQGMNPYVFVVYRQLFATIALAPFAFFLERGEKSHPLSWSLLALMFVVSSGITISLNLYYLALNYASATFATALINTIPAITFILAVCFSMESLSIKQRHGMAKVMGSTIGLVGALICTFARGPPMYPESQRDILHLTKQTYSKGDLIKGLLILLASNIAWCYWLVMQCLFSWVASSIWAAAKERNVESWKLGWNLNLLSVFYCGVIVTAITFSLQLWVVEKKGPIFTAIFSPLALVITAVSSALLFRETLHWGSVCGAILLVIGLYCILWAKNVEAKVEAQDKEGQN